MDLNTGDHAWMIPNGTVSPKILNNPALKAAGIDASKFGGADKSPLLVTKTLLIGGGNKFRAIDKKTGRVIHEMDLSGAVTGGPMTYMINGRQFIVMTIAGGRDGHEMVALSLPPPRAPGPARAKPA